MQHGTISGAALGDREFAGHHGFRGAPSNRSLKDRLQREPPALGNIPWGEYALRASPSRDQPAEVPPETNAMSGRQKSSDSGHQCTNTQQRPVSENRSIILVQSGNSGTPSGVSMTTRTLFTPSKIGPVEIRNRVVMPPMTTRTADAEGFITNATIAYYMARARGGVGLITVEMAAPERAGRHRFREIGIYDDRFLPGLKRLVDEIHSSGAKASIQLGHGGGHTRRDICGETPIAPSAIPHPVFEVTFDTTIPEEMTIERIKTVVAAFSAAAQRAQQAGFDCVEIHAAHGYLISQFHTPFENRRTDSYGGSLENRARFGLEILKAVKASTPGLAVIYRLTVEDFFPEGMHFEEGKQLAIWAAEAGADALHISAGHYRSVSCAATAPMIFPDGLFLNYAAQIKREVHVPIIAVGRLGDPVIAADAISSGKADFVALGRSLIADPEWANKVKRGEPVRRCLACNTCINEMRSGTQIGCVVNGAAGREEQFVRPQSIRGEKIAVIGAGPAGLTYASLVAEQNEVTIFEKADGPGGAFNYTGKVPLYQEVKANEKAFKIYIASLVAICESKNVRLQYGKRASSDQLAPFDRIVIATGAKYRFGLGPLVCSLLDLGVGRWPIFAKMFSMPNLRDWLYFKARISTAKEFKTLLRPGQKLITIGDAVRPGKSKQAISSAFESALIS
jgi:2,4-dienoyl-CoA reductase-like NADH-dependent reductase (Old Yellow Enzyme family)